MNTAADQQDIASQKSSNFAEPTNALTDISNTAQHSHQLDQDNAELTESMKNASLGEQERKAPGSGTLGENDCSSNVGSKNPDDDANLITWT